MTWNPFKKQEEAQVPVEEATKKAAPNEKKGRPTPKMKQAQAAGIRPLVPVDRKASAKAAKARLREKENAEYEAMQKGDINHMPKAERLQVHLGRRRRPYQQGLFPASILCPSVSPILSAFSSTSSTCAKLKLAKNS